MNQIIPNAGFYTLAELPQRGSVADIAIGTGWPALSEIWKLYPGQFNVVTGIAGHGKSTLLLNVLVNVVRTEGIKIFLYAPENEGHIREKFKLIWGDKPGFETFCNEHCFVQSAMPEFYDSAPKTLNWVLTQAQNALDSVGLDVLMIDPWNELERAKPKDQMLTDYIGECLMKLKQFCRANHVAVILVAHPTKAGVEAGKTPGLADIEGSMNWYNKCDNGLIVVRDPVACTAKVISAKVREIGAGRRGECQFYVDPKTGIFTPQFNGVAP